MASENYVLVQHEIYRSKQSGILVLFAGTTTLSSNKTYLFWFLDIELDGKYTKFLATELDVNDMFLILSDELTTRSAFLKNETAYIFEVGSTDNFIYRQTPIEMKNFNFSLLPPEGIGIASHERVNDNRNLN